MIPMGTWFMTHHHRTTHCVGVSLKPFSHFFQIWKLGTPWSPFLLLLLLLLFLLHLHPLIIFLLLGSPSPIKPSAVKLLCFSTASLSTLPLFSAHHQELESSASFSLLPPGLSSHPVPSTHRTPTSTRFLTSRESLSERSLSYLIFLHNVKKASSSNGLKE